MKLYQKRLLKERFLTFTQYYKNPKFALIDLSFGLIALFSNPYRVCRKVLQKKKEDPFHVYGETPLSTYSRIVQECNIGKKETFVELGSGREKGCFWLSHFIGCKVIGVEWIFQFVFFAKIIRSLFTMNHLSFLHDDIEKVELPDHSFIYLYGIWPNRSFPSNAKIITISEPLEGYKVIHSFWVRFPWGRTRAFLQTNSNC